MSSGYPSLAKSRARHQAYVVWMSKKLEEKDHRDWFLGGKHIIVFGRGGDATYLIEAGVCPQNIIACDLKEENISLANQRGLTIPPQDTCKDVVQTCLWALDNKVDISTINADICESVVQVAPLVKDILDYTDLNKTFVFAHYCNSDDFRSSQFKDDEERLDHMKSVCGKQIFPMFRRFNYQPWSDRTDRAGSKMTMVGW